jgi:hypothetical protein
MNKSTFLLSLLCLFIAGNVFAQKNKEEKKKRKEFLEFAIPVCVSELESGETSEGIADAVNAEGYCTCMLEHLIESYSIDDLAQLFVNKTKAEMMMAFFEDKANYSKTMECMRNNVKDEKAMKQFVLRNSFGLEACVQSIDAGGLGDKLNGEGYCTCMFDKMEEVFSLEELLDETTYETEKFKILAFECVMANTVE